MGQTLKVNGGEFIFNKFEKAIRELAEEYGYEGLGWDMVVASQDFEILANFLADDGLIAELESDY